MKTAALRLALLAAAVLASAAGARAQVIISTFPDGTTNSGGALGIGGTSEIRATGFTMGASSYVLNTTNGLDLWLKFTGPTTASFTASIYTGASITSSTLVETAINPAFTASASSYAEYSFDFATPVTLDANTTYWIVLTDTDGSSNVVDWASNSTAFSSAVAAAASGSKSMFGTTTDVSSLTSTSTSLPAYALQGTLAVPEPPVSVGFALGVGLLLLAAARRRLAA